MKPIRSRPAWQVKDALRRSGVRQSDIAKSLHVQSSAVSRVIHRMPGLSPNRQERIWTEIERVTAHLFVEGEG